jgi:hypothetical protein
MFSLKKAKSLSIIVCCLLLLPFYPSAKAESNDSSARFHGFIEMGNQHPLALYHETFSPRQARLLTPDATEVNLAFYWSNSLNRRGGSYLIDAETRIVAIKLKHGLSPSWQLGLDLPIVWQGRGIADSPIDRWHRFFGMPRGGRNRVDNNSYSVRGTLYDNDTFDFPTESINLGDLTLSSAHRLHYPSSKDFWITLEGILRLPTAQTNKSQKSIDIGASLLATRRFSRLSTSAGINYLKYFDQSIDELKYKADHYSGFIGGEYSLTTNWSVALALFAESKLVSNLKKFPGHSLYLDYGHNFNLGHQTILQVGFRENLNPSKGTTDFSLMFQCKKTF